MYVPALPINIYIYAYIRLQHVLVVRACLRDFVAC